MRRARNFIFRHLGKALRDRDEVTTEPLPQRWVDLIHYLDEKERKPTGAFQRNDQRAVRYSTNHG